MFGVLLLVFLVVPFVELYVIIQVAHVIGALDTIALLIIVSAVGAWLVKREGLGVWRRAQRQIGRGGVPGNELVDGVLVLFAGALLLTPGFVSDVLGILLLLPPVRFALRGYARRRLVRRVDVHGFDGFDGFDDPGGRGRPGRPYDYDA
ncbi:MAG TPA: FxsA family protein [Acidimicrobiales bacterium]|nr:FxsA family protein [Acidimicrobiales bacterium]